MSDKEKQALDNIAESVKEMDDKDKEKFCAFAEGFKQGVKFNAEKKPE